MSVLLVSYDLGGPETSDDYADLIKKIKSYDGWAKPEYSLWLIKTDKHTSTVRDELKQYLDNNDKLLVIAVTGAGWASYRLPSEVTDWMKENM
ncbi:MAG TPA: CRISPR-associated protein Cas2 [Candidatus Saccharimonadales bacterium]